MAGRPKPTQAELNKLALGEHVELSDDGSGPDPNVSTFDPHAVPAASKPAAVPQAAAHQTASRSKT